MTSRPKQLTRVAAYGDLVFEKGGSTDMCQWFPLERALTLSLVELAQIGVGITTSRQDS